ncbi:uncharacterized protein EI97DRAFT_402347 [Westerdykella ornata]|uniref:Tyrosine specific protein phosphatases domain-containing protein n=1 Tax=Westerdykella ornata TaxID=318751 RepID=A0A6A6JDL0_WESOR|nr:uncharacterized protein EI97DRAFT_402347 [Westerdykella ornata]KAF2274355.1 hypothetical protein EI97DRAFT_402347 [Westerdykella ornata]
MEPNSDRRHGTLPFPQAVVLLLTRLVSASNGEATASSYTARPSVSHSDHISTSFGAIWRRLVSLQAKGLAGDYRYIVVGMGLTAACCIASGLLFKWTKSKDLKGIHAGAEKHDDIFGDDARSTDPGLLKKHSTFRSYSVPSTGFAYPVIRTFYRPHQQEDKLPKTPRPIPLLVFVHGLGGSSAQFHSLLISLANVAPTLAIDLPGCGQSRFEPRDWAAYTIDALVHLLAVAIEAHRDREANQGVVLIAHSMGCSLSALLASPTSRHAALLSRHVVGFVALCPQAEPLDEKHAEMARKACSLPAPIFNLFRKWDRRGGINSTSVLRMTGPDADKETRKLQLRFNRQSRTPVWQRMMYGTLPDPKTGKGGLPGRDVWAGLDLPVYLVAGAADTVTPPENVCNILRFIGSQGTLSFTDMLSDVKRSPDMSSASPDGNISDGTLLEKAVDSPLNDSSSDESSSDTDQLTLPEADAKLLQTPPSEKAAQSQSSSTAPHPRHSHQEVTIFPKPAGHSLFFAPSTSRTLAGLISNFLSTHIDPRLSLAWQLQYLTTEGKWDVKNLEKWKAVQPVSAPIANTFRAMKTLREVDERHCPKQFVKEYSGQIRAVVDISHDQPVYDPKGLEEGGIRYYKFPTVSKLPPSAEEATDFIALIERIEAEKAAEGQQGLIGIHCHYGFNRTGFFLVCYMVEKLGMGVEEAIAEFKRARPPGIRHAHFVDTLHVRYHLGLDGR